MNVLIAGIPEYTKNYESALRACQVPFHVSLSLKDAAWCDHLLLPGGGDIHPSWFGQIDHGSRQINPGLDNAQFALLDSFVKKGMPVLGICRGIQLINVYFGGDIIQDLPTSSAHQYQDGDRQHPVYSTPGSLLHKLYGNTCMVNSAHHQGCGRVGRELIVTQTAPDGVIEGLEHTEKPILGVQWHPERTGFSFWHPGIADGAKIIRYFLEQM